MTSATTFSSNYLTTVQSYATVSREEELTLIRRWRLEQDESARDALVRSSLRHVVSIARRYQRYGIPLAELISEGNFGVVRALNKFDGTRGTLFITYASYWVRACILQHVLRSWSIVGSGLPRSRLFFKLRRERAKLSTLIGDGAEARVILSERLGISEERLSSLLQRVDQRDCSLDAEVFQDGTLAMVNALPSPDLDQEQLALASEFGGIALEAVRDALTILDARERYIVENRMLADRDVELSLADIGRNLGISRERARQLEERAKRKLRARISSRPGSADFLDIHCAA
ncbi:MAG TPA: sigma-70 family RNA polymerase sigma factor [Polyangiaceae bacterium]|nr:sigma-70 family RNA polymerase sigma factor [Polyangiaceae bacterium]